MPALSLQFKFDLGTTSTYLQPNLTYGHYTGTSVAIPSTCFSTNGDSIFKSHPEKAPGYYSASVGVHTISYTVTPQFSGLLKTQATLATQPAETDWFDVKGTTCTYTNSMLPATTTTSLYNFEGNFVYVRAVVERDNNLPNGSVQVINFNF